MTDSQILISSSGDEGNNYYKIYESSCRAWIKNPSDFMIWAGKKYWLLVHKDEPYFASTGTVMVTKRYRVNCLKIGKRSWVKEALILVGLLIFAFWLSGSIQ
ncbi:MAG TPA: hypothetical protein ENH82_13780 [bacterium]|nr:hypothetical protein [bacterium]